MVHLRNMRDVEGWLRGQDNDTCIALMSRANLRALPALAAAPEGLDVGALALLRTNLATCVASRWDPKLTAAAGMSYRFSQRPKAILQKQGETYDAGTVINQAAQAAGAAADSKTIHDVPDSPRYGQRRHQGHAAASVIRDAIYLFAQGNPDRSAAVPGSLASTLHDATLLDGMGDARQVFARPLWDNERIPGEVAANLNRLREFFREAPELWGFWERWYEGMLSGKPIPWEVQEQVALIPNEVWEAGPKGVADRIAEIEARFEVKRRAEELEEKLARGVSQRLGIGGNNPPEAIDDLPRSVQEETLLIWEPILELKEQTEAPTAEAGKVKHAVSKLIGLLAACGNWIGGKLDAAATEFSKEIGKKSATWAARGVAALVIAHQLEIEALIRAAADWLTKLPTP